MECLFEIWNYLLLSHKGLAFLVFGSFLDYVVRDTSEYMAEHVANTTTIISSETLTTTTRTSKGSQMPSTSSISHYLDVVVVLAQKDFKVRYRNSVLGFLWSLLNPLAYMVILTIMGRAQAPVFRHGVSEPSVVLKEYIQRQRKR